MVHISCELFLACVFVSSRDAPTLAITTTDLKPSGYPTSAACEREDSGVGNAVGQSAHAIPQAPSGLLWWFTMSMYRMAGADGRCATAEAQKLPYCNTSLDEGTRQGPGLAIAPQLKAGIAADNI